MFICVTEVDTSTRIPCTVEPMRTGPSMPAIKGWQYLWCDKSTWPVEMNTTGVLLRAPKYYGTCDDDADVTIAGILETLTETQFNEARLIEHNARKPFPSWIGDFARMYWTPPVSQPSDGAMNGGDVMYDWDESIINWVERARIEITP